MAHLGTGVQIAAVGPQNKYLDLDPEVTAFYKKPVHSTRFASEAMEDLPLQTVGFGSTAVFEVPPRGDLLGDMHIQFRLPAVQPELGTRLAPIPLPPLVGTPVPSSGVAWLHVVVELEGFSGVEAQHAGTLDGQGRAWVFEAGEERWEVVVYGTGHVISTLLAPDGPSRALWLGGAAVMQAPGTSVSAVVSEGGAVQTRNDPWRSPLAHVLMRRVRLVVDDLVVHDHERLWYDLCDRLTTRAGHAAGCAELLGTDLSMGRPHVVMLPLKFFCTAFRPQLRAYFPTLLVPNCKVRVELDVEALEGCVPPESTPTLLARRPPLEAKLVAEHIWLDPEERNSMLLKPLTVMYEGAQDMDALNYVETSGGGVATRAQASVDLSELNLPVKALVWVAYTESTPRLFEYLDAVEEAALQFGSVERAVASGPTCARQHAWSHVPRCEPGNVYVYSFALNAWGAEPSGAVDFSLVQKPVLRLALRPETRALQLKCKVWGMTYNWLTFRDGKVTQVFSP